MENKLIELIERFYVLDKEVTHYMEEKNLYNGERDTKIREALDEMECFQEDMRENVLHYMNNYINQQEKNNVYLDTLTNNIQELGATVKENDKRMDKLEVCVASLEWRMFKWGFAGVLSAISVVVALFGLAFSWFAV